MESPRFCSECGASVKPSVKYCASCGKPVLPESSITGNDQEDLVSNHEAVVERSSTSTTTETNSEPPISAKTNALAKGIFASGIFFFLAYLVVSIPTFVLPYFGSNSSLLHTMGTVSGFGVLPRVWFHILALYLLVIIAWLRGGLVGRQWLAVFPVFAAIFDMVPGFNVIPLIPTVFHILAIVLGLSGKLVTEEIAGSEKNRLIIAAIGLASLTAFAFYKNSEFDRQHSFISDNTNKQFSNNIKPESNKNSFYENQSWQGTYYYDQDKYIIGLIISKVSNNNIIAIAEFISSNGNKTAYQYMIGRYNNSNREFFLIHDNWIDNQFSFPDISIRGNLSSNGNSIAGKIITYGNLSSNRNKIAAKKQFEEHDIQLNLTNTNMSTKKRDILSRALDKDIAAPIIQATGFTFGFQKSADGDQVTDGIKVGQSSKGWSFEKDGTIKYDGTYVHKTNNNHPEDCEIRVSKGINNETLKYVTVFDSYKGNLEGFIYNTQKKEIFVEIPFTGSPFSDKIFWSPDIEYAVVIEGGEVQECVHLINLKTGELVTQKIRVTETYDCEIQQLYGRPTSWIGNSTFRINVSLDKNIYEEQRCSNISEKSMNIDIQLKKSYLSKTLESIILWFS